MQGNNYETDLREAADLGGQTTEARLDVSIGGAILRRGRQVPGCHSHHCPGRTMAYSVNKDLDHRNEYPLELTSKKSGQYDRGRGRTQELSGYERPIK